MRTSGYRCGLVLGLVLALSAVGVAAAAGDGSLIAAVRAQDAAAVEALLRTSADVNAAAPDGATALHWAAYHDAPVLAGRLLAAGADVDAANDYGVTPLALACGNGSAGMVARLLKAGAEPDAARSTGETPLMTCARTGSVEAVRALLDAGADPSAAEVWQGQTALMWAAAEEHVDVVRALLDAGADVRARTTGGFTALLIAAREDAPALAGLLLDAGADVNATAPDGATPLLVATVRGHARLAAFLLERGADPNVGEAGYAPLHWAAGAWHTELTGHLRGIDTTRDEEWRALNGVQDGKQALVEALLAHGADPDARLVRHPPQYGYASQVFRLSLTGATPFLLAAMDADVAAMDALAAAGADTRLTTDEGATPLMVAAGLGRVPAETRVTEADMLDALRLLLELGADVNATNGDGRSALHGAAHVRSDAAVQLLVDHGATVQVADRSGVTPLIIAEGRGHDHLPGLGGGSTAALLRALGGAETKGPIR